MQSVVDSLLKYLIPLALASIGFLFARLRYLASEVANLKATALKVQQDKELVPLDEQIKEAEKNVQEDRRALSESGHVTTSTTPS